MPNDNDVKNFLDLMSQLESSGGQNVNHATVTRGINAGDKAVGQYGLMPLSIQDVINKKASTDPIDDAIQKDPSSENIKALLSQYPDKEKEYAASLGNKLLTNNSTDPKLAATAWLYGSSMHSPQSEAVLAEHPEYEQRMNNVIDNEHMQSLPDDADDIIKLNALETKRRAFPQLKSKLRSEK